MLVSCIRRSWTPPRNAVHRQSCHRQLCANPCKAAQRVGVAQVSRESLSPFWHYVLSCPRWVTAHKKMPVQHAGAHAGLQASWCPADKSITWSHYPAASSFPELFLFRNCWKPAVFFLLAATRHTGMQNKQEFPLLQELTTLPGVRLTSVSQG